MSPVPRVFPGGLKSFAPPLEEEPGAGDDHSEDDDLLRHAVLPLVEFHGVLISFLISLHHHVLPVTQAYIYIYIYIW